MRLPTHGTTQQTASRVVQNLQVVGISQFLVSKNPSETLVTYSLGSCVGVSIYDTEAHIGGLIHCMLPLSKGAEDRAKDKPAMFVDTGVVAMLNAMFKLGASKENLIVRVAGASSTMDQGGRFRIGQRNHTVLRKVLWKNDLIIKSEDVGGTIPRTVRVCIASGNTSVISCGKEVNL